MSTSVMAYVVFTYVVFTYVVFTYVVFTYVVFTYVVFTYVVFTYVVFTYVVFTYVVFTYVVFTYFVFTYVVFIYVTSYPLPRIFESLTYPSSHSQSYPRSASSFCVQTPLGHGSASQGSSDSSQRSPKKATNIVRQDE